MSTTQELVERLQNVSEWKQIIERHRRITDDPGISYVLQDGTRIHEDNSSIAKLAASLSRALEDAADTASAAAVRLTELERKNARMRAALEFYANKDNHKMRREPSYRDRFSQNMKPGRPKLGRVSEDKGKQARAALAGSGEK